ncbi:hypothetical protein F5B21DRAFT_464587 [Xylaria acuta]|nr:hypothetical protein F5B21DRAFT_464587 [Xylaria acuta]
MSTLASSVAYFDRLPDEILLEILKFAMKHEYPFFPEHCLQHLIRHDCHLRRLVNCPDDESNFPCQYPHLDDWFTIKAINRRTRRLSWEAFFSSKTIAMTSSLPKELSDGTFVAFGSALDQKTALWFIRSISLVDLSTTNPLEIMRMPRTLGVFPRLKEIKLLCGYEKLQIRKLDIPVCRAQWRCAPTELNRLLGGIGLTDGVVLQIALVDGVSWSDFQTWLVTDVYPVLQTKANIRARSKKGQTEI